MRRQIDVRIENRVVTVDGEEVKNPIAKVAVPILATIGGIVVALVAVFVVLPILGIAVTAIIALVVGLVIVLAVTAALLAFAWPFMLGLLVLLGVIGQPDRRR